MKTILIGIFLLFPVFLFSQGLFNKDKDYIYKLCYANRGNKVITDKVKEVQYSFKDDGTCVIAYSDNTSVVYKFEWSKTVGMSKGDFKFKHKVTFIDDKGFKFEKTFGVLEGEAFLRFNTDTDNRDYIYYALQ